MLIILAVWVLLGLIFITTGDTLSQISLFKSSSEADFSNSILFKFLLGLTGIILVSSLWSIFYRINTEFQTLVLFLTGINLLIYRRRIGATLNTGFIVVKQFNITTKILLAFTTVIILISSTETPIYNLDPARYHIPSTLWIKEYGTVPGLANIKSWLGLNSSWYMLHAFTDLGLLNQKSYHTVNSLIYFAFALTGINATDQLVFKKKMSLANLFLSALLLFYLINFSYLAANNLNCLSPDLPVYFLIIPVVLPFMYYFEVTEEPKKDSFLNSAILISVLFCLVLTTIKINNVVTMVIPFSFWLLLLLKKRKLLPLTLKLILLSIAFLAPMAYRNYLLTGYILFPLTIDLFNPDWKLPLQSLKDYLGSPYGTFFPSKESLDPAFIKKIAQTPWIVHLLRYYYNQLISLNGYVFYILISFVLILISLFTGKSEKLTKTHYVIFAALFICLSIFCYVLPHFKYCIGILALFFAFSIALFFTRNKSIVQHRSFAPITYLLLFLLLFKSLYEVNHVSIFKEKTNFITATVSNYVGKNDRIFSLKGLPEPKFNKGLLNGRPVYISQWDTTFYNFGFYKPESNWYVNEYPNYLTKEHPISAEVAILLWETPLPSMPDLPKNLRFRSKHLKDGFYSAPNHRE